LRLRSRTFSARDLGYGGSGCRTTDPARIWAPSTWRSRSSGCGQQTFKGTSSLAAAIRRTARHRHRRVTLGGVSESAHDRGYHWLSGCSAQLHQPRLSTVLANRLRGRGRSPASLDRRPVFPGKGRNARKLECSGRSTSGSRSVDGEEISVHRFPLTATNVVRFS